jgi:hypothetical protein
VRKRSCHRGGVADGEDPLADVLQTGIDVGKHAAEFRGEEILLHPGEAGVLGHSARGAIQEERGAEQAGGERGAGG